MGASDDRVEFGVIKVVTKGVDRLVRGIKDKDAGVGQSIVLAIELFRHLNP